MAHSGGQKDFAMCKAKKNRTNKEYEFFKITI